jgi:uncharacterized protein (TIGR00255 family)
MIVSMTGFAVRKGQGAGASWVWEVRSVNGKGLDLRLRLPDWIDGLEPLVRADLARRLQRGNVALTLKVQRDGGADALRVNRSVLEGVLAGLSEVVDSATKRGLTLAPPSAAEVLALRGVLDMGAMDEGDTGPLRAALMADLPALLADFQTMRAAEGRALSGIIAAQLDRIAGLVTDATAAAGDRRARAEASLRDGLDRLRGVIDSLDEQRVAQELALIAVKADVAEETGPSDRPCRRRPRACWPMRGPVGRKLDFLMQEFNARGEHALLQGSVDLALTRIGLDLKTVIDQMREQVQNVE